MGRLKHQTATANPTLQNNNKLNTLVGGAVRRSYRYDKAGNLIQSTDQRSGVLDYVYDKIGRIKTAGKEHFAFDPANNILSDGLKDTKGLSEHLSDRHHAGRLKGQNIGLGNRIEAYNGTEYTYDPLGNLIYRQLPDGENQFFRYDTENQLVLAEIKKNNGETQTWAYAYDPFGRRLSKERTDKGALQSTDPKRTHFVWDGSRLLQEYTYKGNYTYVYTDQDSYEPLAQVFFNNQDEQQYLAYFHTDQIGIPREMTDQFGNLLWYGEYTAWGKLNKDERIYPLVHQPFRLQNQYYDEETGLHYNLMRYYEPDSGRFVNQDPIGLLGGINLYQFSFNAQRWFDPLGLALYDIVNYGSKSPGLFNHHNIMDAWAKHNIPGYISRQSNQPTIQLTKELHDAAHAAERKWMKETFGKVRGNWRAMTARQMLELSEIMFDAAKVPKHKRREFYRRFNQYIYTKCG